jgi:preprotein translocase subunit SecA
MVYSQSNKNEEYAVIDGKVVIIDENIGCIMSDKLWRKHVHQAINVKEGLEITSEMKTCVTITPQN